MKKFMFILMLFVLVLPIVGQEIEPPDDFIDVVTNFEGYIGSLLGLGFLSIWLSGLLNGWFKFTKDWPRRVVSWLVPILIAFVVGFLLKIGFLAEKPWYITLLYGFGAGLFSNGLFTIDFIKTAVTMIEGWLGNKKE